MSKIKITVDSSFFDTIDPVQAWIIGLYAADGNIAGQDYISITQSGDAGLSLLQYIKSLLKHNGHIYDSETDFQTAYQLYFKSTKIANVFQKYNIVPNKTLIYDYPELENHLHTPFIRGYFEGDGSIGVYYYGTTYALCASFVGTPQFIDKCKEIVPSGWQFREISDNTHELRWVGETAVDFSEWLWFDQSLLYTYKQDIYRKYLKEYCPRWLKYRHIKERVRQLLINGQNPMSISQQEQLPFQTIYKWKKKWKL